MDEVSALQARYWKAAKVQVADGVAVGYAHYRIEQRFGDERIESSGNAVETFVRRDTGWKVCGSILGELPPFVE